MKLLMEVNLITTGYWIQDGLFYGWLYKYAYAENCARPAAGSSTVSDDRFM